jgi:hypothetical protein
MTFEEWWKHFNSCCPLDITDEDIAKWAWEAGIQEGIDRIHRLYDICPQCKLPNGQHKMDCGRGR